MRILLDYRPALRERTGVGEYVHEVARALLDSAPAGESLTLFSSSFKDRLAADTLPGASIVDRRIPNQWLNFLWHRAEWPPVERVAGGEFDVVHALHPLLIPSRTAARLVTIHDLEKTLVRDRAFERHAFTEPQSVHQANEIVSCFTGTI